MPGAHKEQELNGVLRHDRVVPMADGIAHLVPEHDGTKPTEANMHGVSPNFRALDV